MIIRKGFGDSTTDAGFMSGLDTWFTPSAPYVNVGAFSQIPGAVTNITSAPMFALGLIAPLAVLGYLLLGKKR